MEHDGLARNLKRSSGTETGKIEEKRLETDKFLEHS